MIPKNHYFKSYINIFYKFNEMQSNQDVIKIKLKNRNYNI